MSDPTANRGAADLGPVHTGPEEERAASQWTNRLLLFLRVMAVVSILKGLHHWAALCGFAFVPPGGFEAQSTPWQTASVFFAVLDLIAAVGLWLAAPWGAVVWLTSSVSMIVVEVFFPQIYSDTMFVMIFEPLAIIAYLALAILAAREHPE